MTRTSAALGLVAACSSAAAIAHAARWRAPFQPRLERISLPDMAPGMLDRGLRVGFVTDTHVGPFITPRRLADAIEMLLAERPDLLLLGGDYVSDSPRYFREAAAVLGEAATAIPRGALAVLGNHDYANGAARAMRELDQRGIRVLVNESALITTSGGGLWVAGLDDAVLGQPDAERAFAAIPADAPAIALWHEPDWAEETARCGARVQLSGHSHGGQVRLPFVGGFAAPSGGRRFVIGLNRVGDMPVYTSRGFGVFRPPVRYRCAPEITLLTFAGRRQQYTSHSATS